LRDERPTCQTWCRLETIQSAARTYAGGRVLSEFQVCRPRFLPTDLRIPAAQTAFRINPANRPAVASVHALLPPSADHRAAIAALTTKYWHGGRGVHLTVGFLDDAPQDLRDRIVSHMNAWSKTANVEFVQSNTDPQVRIARETGHDEGGYWSNLGTDILHIEPDQPTMNLEAFTMEIPESEFHRVVRHETGHTLGFPHEHMRQELVDLIDVDKAIAFFEATQGWTADETMAQVLTPIEESFIGTAPDPESIMCYQIPGTITKNGEPIIGGLDIDETDFSFAGTLYPKDRGPSG
jgi:Astacin (Peptidase family M12A)